MRVNYNKFRVFPPSPPPLLKFALTEVHTNVAHWLSSGHWWLPLEPSGAWPFSDLEPVRTCQRLLHSAHRGHSCSHSASKTFPHRLSTLSQCSAISQIWQYLSKLFYLPPQLFYVGVFVAHGLKDVFLCFFVGFHVPWFRTCLKFGCSVVSLFIFDSCVIHRAGLHSVFELSLFHAVASLYCIACQPTLLPLEKLSDYLVITRYVGEVEWQMR